MVDTAPICINEGEDQSLGADARESALVVYPVS